jgi:hypothetical protein
MPPVVAQQSHQPPIVRPAHESDAQALTEAALPNEAAPEAMVDQLAAAVHAPQAQAAPAPQAEVAPAPQAEVAPAPQAEAAPASQAEAAPAPQAQTTPQAEAAPAPQEPTTQPEVTEE